MGQTKSTFHWTTIDQGSVLYHERYVPLPPGETVSSFPYAFYSRDRGFWTGASCSLQPHNNEKYWQYVYQTKKPLRLLDLNDDQAWERLHRIIRRHIPDYPPPQEDEDDYLVSAVICQVMHLDGWEAQDIIVLAQDCARRVLHLSQIRPINMTQSEQTQSQEEAKFVVYGRMPQGDGYEPHPIKDKWVNISLEMVKKYSHINWSRILNKS